MQVSRRYNPFRHGCRVVENTCDTKCSEKKVKACHSPYIAAARPCYKCPKPACVPKYRRRVLKMSGDVKKTEVKNEAGQITSILYTYNIELDNCTGYPIQELVLDADIRILECGAERPLIGQGDCSCCFDPKDIDVLVQNKSQVCNCKKRGCACKCKKDERDCVSIDCDGVHIKLFNVAPGKTIVTVVVPLFNEEPAEPFPCTMLPALYTARILQCFCEEKRVIYQNSILIGAQPHEVDCEDESESSDEDDSDCSCDECN